jgi:hypothetical protein
MHKIKLQQAILNTLQSVGYIIQGMVFNRDREAGPGGVPGFLVDMECPKHKTFCMYTQPANGCPMLFSTCKHAKIKLHCLWGLGL